MLVVDTNHHQTWWLRKPRLGLFDLSIRVYQPRAAGRCAMNSRVDLQWGNGYGAKTPAKLVFEVKSVARIANLVENLCSASHKLCMNVVLKAAHQRHPFFRAHREVPLKSSRMRDKLAPSASALVIAVGGVFSSFFEPFDHALRRVVLEKGAFRFRSGIPGAPKLPELQECPSRTPRSRTQPELDGLSQHYTSTATI
jgi:hypothetical protein